MNLPERVLAAFGGIALESVWVEVVAASMAAAGRDDALRVVGTRGAALRTARAAVEAIVEKELRNDANAWLERARELLQRGRNPVVHGLAHTDSAGGWLLCPSEIG